MLHILTGEYPPLPGGVGDYTANLAAGLAAAGVEVHVWTSDGPAAPVLHGVHVHRVAGCWSGTGARHLGDALDAYPGPRRILVQHAPNVWGRRGLNLEFGRWLVRRRFEKGDEVRVMFHEVAYPWLLRDRPRRWLLALGQRWMARTLLKAATHVDVTTPAWEAMLRACAPGRLGPVGWRPVPSNIAVADDPDAVASIRNRVAPNGESVVGSFSSFSALTGPLLAGALPGLLKGRADRVGLLIGQGGDRLASRLSKEQPELSGRLIATGALSPSEVSASLQSCDLMIQPYPDGVTTRRTSLMASLAHGIPVVSNSGHLTEPFWGESGALALATDAGAIAGRAGRLLDDPAERSRLGEAGRELYERRFSLARTVEALAGSAVGVGS